MPQTIKKILSVTVMLSMLVAMTSSICFASGDVSGESSIETMDVSGEPVYSITYFKSFSSYNSVTLEWNKCDNAETYTVLYSKSKNGEYEKIEGIRGDEYTSKYSENNISYRVMVDKDRKYYFKVQAISDIGECVSESKKISDESVRRMYINVKLNQKVRLTSHDGDKIKHTFKSGTKLKTYGFGGGKYSFDYKDHKYKVSYLRTKNASAVYATSFNYSKREAEYFINQTKVSSRTKYLMWVNLYTQHLYIFKGQKNGSTYSNWKVYKNWEIASGAPATPSPTGLRKEVYKKVSSRNGLGPWTVFQSWTSFHGKIRSWKLGKPGSGACIRNTMSQANWIYKKIPIKTRVSIY